MGSVRALAAWTALLGSALLFLPTGWGTGWARAPAPSPLPGQTAGEVPGEEIYARTCAACHGTDGTGGTGEGVAAGPALVGVETALVDLLLRTGRMPIVSVSHGVPGPRRLTDVDRRELVGWMRERFGLDGAVPEVGEGDVVRGGKLYAVHCAACHGSTGSGGIAGDGTLVRAVAGLDRVAVVEAIRTGPLQMPRFSSAAISDDAAADVGRFVEEGLLIPAREQVGLGELDRAMKWLLVIVLVGASVLIAVAVARPTSGSRSEGTR